MLLAVFVLLLVVNISCRKQEMYSHFYEFKNAAWAQHDTLIFDIDSAQVETGKPYILSVEITNNVNYPYRNIWLFIQNNLQSDSVTTNQQKEYQLANEFGKWYGSGFGTLFQISLPVDTLIFKEKKNYRIKIEHGMRDEPLNGIEKVGVRLQLKN